MGNSDYRLYVLYDAPLNNFQWSESVIFITWGTVFNFFYVPILCTALRKFQKKNQFFWLSVRGELLCNHHFSKTQSYISIFDIPVL